MHNSDGTCLCARTVAPHCVDANKSATPLPAVPAYSAIPRPAISMASRSRVCSCWRCIASPTSTKPGTSNAVLRSPNAASKRRRSPRFTAGTGQKSQPTSGSSRGRGTCRNSAHRSGPPLDASSIHCQLELAMCDQMALARRLAEGDHVIDSQHLRSGIHGIARSLQSARGIDATTQGALCTEAVLLRSQVVRRYAWNRPHARRTSPRRAWSTPSRGFIHSSTTLPRPTGRPRAHSVSER